jgi:hypothetical protein
MAAVMAWYKVNNCEIFAKFPFLWQLGTKRG